MVLKKKDFITVEFTGRIKDGNVFDSNIKEDLAKLNPEAKAKPFTLCLGEGMFLKGIEDFLIDKGVGEYEIELTPDKAFGPRDAKLVQMIPIKVFVQQKLNPVPGFLFNFDSRMGKVLTVSGGRVMVDFNNPIAGKNVVYKVKVLRKIDDLNEKVKALNDFLFRQEFKFEIQNKKLTLKVNKELAKFVEMFKDKFKDILGLELEVKSEEKKEGEKKVKEKFEKEDVNEEKPK
ncbi:MAG: peptidylprolyl isomerase [archaeon]